MGIVVALALKSVVVAGITLLLLRTFRASSAAQRSWLAHAGLGALLLLPIVALLMPALEIQTALLGTRDSMVGAGLRGDIPAAATSVSQRVTAAPFAPASLDIDWLLVGYAIPAVLLAGLTVVALFRLFSLKARARVMVEPQWLSALAHAQQRMNFKSGTALLASDALPSPISWGLARPVILLSEEAIGRGNEAEAIIAHELAHVASLDWAKLLLGRFVTAIYWFNPLVWLLVRDAHQLREEAADDAVLAANVVGTDYAALLVHTARHDCRAATIAAHGVAPGRGSLQRRVTRVLDRGLPRTRMEARWAVIGALVASLGVAPLAALTFAPVKKDSPTPASANRDTAPRQWRLSPDTVAATDAGGVTILRGTDGMTITIYPPDASGRRAVVIRGRDGKTARFDDVGSLANLDQLANLDVDIAGQLRGLDSLDIDVPDVVDVPEPPEAKTFNPLRPSPAFVAGIRRAAPHLGQLSADDMAGMRMIGVTPAFIADLAAAGFGKLSQDDLMGARATGINGDYVRAMRAAGVSGTLDDFVEMRVLGIRAEDARAAARSGAVTKDRLVDLKTQRWKTRIRQEIVPDPDPDPDDDPDPDTSD